MGPINCYKVLLLRFPSFVYLVFNYLDFLVAFWPVLSRLYVFSILCIFLYD